VHQGTTIMQHTFLLSPGKWRAEGKFTDENDVNSMTEGLITIEHDYDYWLFKRRLQLLERSEPDIKNDYKIQPWTEGRDFLNWSAQKTLMGNLKGKFLLVAETIVSQFHSEEGEFIGSEVLLMQDDNTYYNRGITFVGDHKLSAWSLTLRREF